MSNDRCPSPALQGACGSSSNVVSSARHCPDKHTMSTAVAATLLRWLNKNTGSGGSRLVRDFELGLVFFIPFLNKCCIRNALKSTRCKEVKYRSPDSKKSKSSKIYDIPRKKRQEVIFYFIFGAYSLDVFNLPRINFGCCLFFCLKRWFMDSSG